LFRREQMKIKLVLAAAALALSCSAHAFGQADLATSPSSAPPPPPVEPVDPAFVPEVVSKAEALQVVSVRRRESSLRLRFKNVSDKNIYAFRMAYYKNGQSMLFSFIGAEEKTFLAPGEVYKYDYPYPSNTAFAREPLTVEAVLFEDGTGDGLPDKVKSLEDVFLSNRKELEHVIAILQEALTWADIDTMPGLLKLQTDLSKTPDYMYGVDMKGLAGITLTSWKATAMGRVTETQKAKYEGTAAGIRESVTRIKDDFNKSLTKYPRVP
jgi:hypothetical protein